MVVVNWFSPRISWLEPQSVGPESLFSSRRQHSYSASALCWRLARTRQQCYPNCRNQTAAAPALQNERSWDSSRYLGVNFHLISDGKIFLHQQKYISNFLDECTIDSLMSKHVSLVVGHVLKADTGIPAVYVFACCHLVEKLILVCLTKPDQSYAVGMISRYVHSIQQVHLNLVYHILKYVNFTRDFGILYDREVTLHTFSPTRTT